MIVIYQNSKYLRYCGVCLPESNKPWKKMARILTVWVPLFKFLSDFKAYEEVLIFDTKASCNKDQILFHGCFLDKLKSSNIFEGIWIQQNFLSFMINQGKEKAYRLLSHNIRDVVLQKVKN